MASIFKSIRNIAMRLGISAPETDDDIYSQALFRLIDKRIQYLGIHADKQQERVTELEAILLKQRAIMFHLSNEPSLMQNKRNECLKSVDEIELMINKPNNQTDK